jgi:HYR domain-containing protein
VACPRVTALVALVDPPGRVVHFTVTADDDRDPAPVVVCTPPSGSFFPSSTTLVDCTATDASGNESTCQLPVTVQPKVRRR